MRDTGDESHLNHLVWRGGGEGSLDETRLMSWPWWRKTVEKKNWRRCVRLLRDEGDHFGLCTISCMPHHMTAACC